MKNSHQICSVLRKSGNKISIFFDEGVGEISQRVTGFKDVPQFKFLKRGADIENVNSGIGNKVASESTSGDKWRRLKKS